MNKAKKEHSKNDIDLQYGSTTHKFNKDCVANFKNHNYYGELKAVKVVQATKEQNCSFLPPY